MDISCHSLGRFGCSALSCFALVCLIQAFETYSCRVGCVESVLYMVVWGVEDCVAGIISSGSGKTALS